jgi:hypothetical protein
MLDWHLISQTTGMAPNVTAAVAVLALLLGIANSIILVILSNRSHDQTRQAKCIDLSASLLQEYFGLEFTLVQRSAWRVKTIWMTKPDSRIPTARYYCTDDFDPADTNVISPELKDNSLTPLQNVFRLMTFWHRLVVLYRHKLLDVELLLPLRHEYEQWSPFMKSLANECSTLMTSQDSSSGAPKDWRLMCIALDSFPWKQ